MAGDRCPSMVAHAELYGEGGWGFQGYFHAGTATIVVHDSRHIVAGGQARKVFRGGTVPVRSRPGDGIGRHGSGHVQVDRSITAAWAADLCCTVCAKDHGHREEPGFVDIEAAGGGASFGISSGEHIATSLQGSDILTVRRVSGRSCPA